MAIATVISIHPGSLFTHVTDHGDQPANHGSVSRVYCPTWHSIGHFRDENISSQSIAGTACTLLLAISATVQRAYNNNKSFTCWTMPCVSPSNSKIAEASSGIKSHSSNCCTLYAGFWLSESFPSIYNHKSSRFLLLCRAWTSFFLPSL